jgi:protein-disulfide isomerase
MRANEAAFWAVVVTAAQALLGCGGTKSPAGAPAGERVVRWAPAPGAFDTDAVPVEDFARRLEPGAVPPVTSDLPSRGPAGAPVTIQLFSDFECPFCAQAAPIVREIEAEFGSNVRVLWRNLPLPSHRHAELAAVAATLVYRARGGAAFWRFHDALFDAAPGGLDEPLIERLAKREGVARDSIRAALETGAGGSLAADLRAGDAAGVEGTPAFVVNDWLVTGVVPYPLFRSLVARALAEARPNR